MAPTRRRPSLNQSDVDQLRKRMKTIDPFYVVDTMSLQTIMEMFAAAEASIHCEHGVFSAVPTWRAVEARSEAGALRDVEGGAVGRQPDGLHEETELGRVRRH